MTEKLEFGVFRLNFVKYLELGLAGRGEVVNLEFLRGNAFYLKFNT